MATTVKNLFDKLSGSKWNAGVTFERTNPVPLEKYSVFHTLAEAQSYAASNVVAYPGQLVAVVTDSTVTTYKINVDGTLSQIDAAIEPGDLPISAGVGIEFGANDGKTIINAKLKEGNGLTADSEGYLSVQQLELDDVVDSTKSASTAVPYTSAVWAAISANATSAQTSSIAEAVLKSAITGKITGGAAASTLTAVGYDSATSSLSGAYAPISITSAQVTNFKENVDAAIALSVATLSVDAVTAGAGEAITSISESNGKISASKGKITVASADVTGLTNYVSSISAATLNAANGHSDAISNALCGYLSTKWSYDLTANEQNPVVLSSDISNIVAKGVTFGGVFGTLSDISGLTSAIAGQVFVLTGAGYNGKEYICKADNNPANAANFVEVGDEGAIGSIAAKLNTVSGDLDTVSGNLDTVSGKVDNKVVLSTYGNPTSSAIETLKINRMTAAEYAALQTKADDQLYVITDDSLNAFNERIVSVAAPTADTDAANKAYVDSQITDLTSQFDGKVALSTISEVSGAISSAISSSLNLGALAHKDTVGTADIDNAAVTSAKIAPSSVTRDHLSGWFVLSCGDAVQDGNILTSDVYNS